MEYSTLTSPFKKIVESAFLSVFNDINKRIEIKRLESEILNKSKKRFSEWVLKNVGTYSLFGTHHEANISDLYVPIKISRSINKDIYKSDEEIKKYFLNGNLTLSHEGEDILHIVNSSASNVAIVGTAGTGKTTTLRFLAISVAKNPIVRGIKRIPFYIALRDFRKKQYNILKSMEVFLESLGLYMADHLVMHMIKMGYALILIDGIDEIPEEAQHDVFSQIDHISKIMPYDNCESPVICITGRPYSLSHCLKGFEKYETKPFRARAKISFVRQWFNVTKSKSLGERLLIHLQINNDLFDLGSNPLMLSVICALFYNQIDIPNAKSEIFDQCLEGLMGKWDHFRIVSRSTPLSRFSINQRLSIVTSVAAATLIDDHRNVVFTPDNEKIEKEIRKLKKKLPEILCDVPLLLSSLYNDYGLILEHAPKIYTFLHLQLHEYLAAKYVNMCRTELDLVDKIKNEIQDWREVILFLVKIMSDAEDFIVGLAKNINFKNKNETEIFKAIWKEKPICNLEMKKNLIYNSLCNIDSMLESYCLECKIENRSLILLQNRYVSIPQREIEDLHSSVSMMFETLKENKLSILDAPSSQSSKIILHLKSNKISFLDKCLLRTKGFENRNMLG